MKILVISQEVWRDDKNGGNVLSNLFDGIDAEFAQIFCSPGNPSNSICKKYYQITDMMVINNILRKQSIGNIIQYEGFPREEILNDCVDSRDLRRNKLLVNMRGNLLYAIKELVWSVSKWKNDELEKFILEFNPDLIFAPCYGSHIMLSIDRYVAQITNVPVISYISDDHYSLKQFSLSPIYWINRFILRKNLRKTFPYYDLVYTMTQEQLDECKRVFDSDIKILKKGGDFKKENFIDKKNNKKIRLVYAGGIYLDRWKTLSKIAKAIKRLNKEEEKFILDIYTGSELTKRQNKLLNDGKNSIVHGLVSQEELKRIYKESDIALHVEGFSLKSKLTTRISFSTKIVDLLASSCAVMVISWDKHSGYTYLKKHDAAICINKTKDIEKILKMIDSNRKILKEYAQKAWKCGNRNHCIDDIQSGIKCDFKKLSELN